MGNILETLGLPQPNGTPAGETDAGRSGTGGITAAGGTGGGGGGLTLSDLQGAMAGLATASPPGGGSAAAAGPPLSELASSEIIDESGILDDPATVERLVALLPEGQRTEAMLRENIRSPQVVSCTCSCYIYLAVSYSSSLTLYSSLLGSVLTTFNGCLVR